MGIKVLSLFDGMSCGQLALANAGIEVDKYYASEIDKYAIQMTQHNYPNTVQLGDIANWQDWKLPKIDLLIGGSPCQGFSVNGKKLNFKDERSKLLFEFIEIRDTIKPQFWLLENVATMTDDIKQLIDEYIGVEGVLINSNTVIPQNRKRYYWTNIPFEKSDKIANKILRDIITTEGNFVYMKTEKLEEQLIRPTETDGVITLNPKKKDGRQTYQQDRIYDCNGRMVALTSTLGNRFYIKDVSNQIRKLTIREQAKLQTIPDWYELSIVSELQASKCIGNAWTVEIVSRIFKGMELVDGL